MQPRVCFLTRQTSDVYLQDAMLFISVSADVLAPNDARPSTVMTLTANVYMTFSESFGY